MAEASLWDHLLPGHVSGTPAHLGPVFTRGLQAAPTTQGSNQRAAEAATLSCAPFAIFPQLEGSDEDHTPQASQKIRLFIVLDANLVSNCIVVLNTAGGNRLLTAERSGGAVFRWRRPRGLTDTTAGWFPRPQGCPSPSGALTQSPGSQQESEPSHTEPNPGGKGRGAPGGGQARGAPLREHGEPSAPSTAGGKLHGNV